MQGSPPSKSLDQVPRDGTRVGKAVLKPPKLLTQKKSLMSRLMQNLSSSTDGRAGDSTADEDAAKASRARQDTTGLAGKQQHPSSWQTNSAMIQAVLEPRNYSIWTVLHHVCFPAFLDLAFQPALVHL